MVTKLSVLTRPVASTVANFTHAELTSDKLQSIRGEEAAPSIINSKDFKIKSIDGLKLTVKTETKKRKRKIEVDQELTKVLSPLKDLSKVLSPLKAERFITTEQKDAKKIIAATIQDKLDDPRIKKKKRVIDGIPIVEVFHRQPRSDERLPRNVQV